MPNGIRLWHMFSVEIPFSVMFPETYANRSRLSLAFAPEIRLPADQRRSYERFPTFRVHSIDTPGSGRALGRRRLSSAEGHRSRRILRRKRAAGGSLLSCRIRHAAGGIRGSRN